MANLTPMPKFNERDANGEPLAGGKLYTYEAGTTTPLATYTDSTGGTANANPVILDSSGRANVWLDAAAYKLVLYDANDVLVWSVDNVLGGIDDSFVNGVLQKTATYTIKTSDAGKLINFTNTASSNCIFPLAASAGEGFYVVIRNSGTANINLNPSGGELIDGDTRVYLPVGASCVAVSDGVEWRTLFKIDSIAGTIALSSAGSVTREDYAKTFICTGTFALEFASPSTSLYEGFWVNVKNAGSGTITLDVAGAELIDGAASITLSPNEGCIVVNTGTELFTIGRIGATVNTTNIDALTSAGGSLRTLGDAACLSWGAGNAANLTAGGNLSMATTHKVVNLATPTDSADAATKGYVDALLPTLGTAQNATGTAINFTGIPSTAKEITISFVNVSLNGSADILVQVGTASGVETTGYNSASSQLTIATASTSYTAGFGFDGAGAATTFNGALTLTKHAGGDTWVAAGVMARADTAGCTVAAGSKGTTGTLDRIRITSTNGTDTFDGGAFNILYK